MDVKKLSVVVEQKGIAPTAKNLERLAKASESASPQLERLSSSLGGLKGIDLSPFTGKLASALDTIKDIKVSTKGLSDIAKDVGGLSVNLSNIANATDRLAGRVADLSAYATQLHAIRVDLEGMKGLSGGIGGIKTPSGGGSSGTRNPSVDPEIKAQQRLAQQIERTAMMAGRTKSEYLELRAAQQGLSDSMAPHLARIKQYETSTNGATMSTKQYNAALRMVPAQFTDIATQLAGGQNPMLILMQQGGQLKDMFGGVGEAIKAAGKYLLTLLLNPVVLATAAIAALGYSIYSAQKEIGDFNKASVASNGIIGLSTQGFYDMRDAMAEMGISKGKATEALTEIAKNGQISAASVKDVGVAAAKMSQVTGTSIETAVGYFAELRDKPLETLDSLTKSYNFLDYNTRESIKSLVEQGRSAEATALANTTLKNAIDNMATESRAKLEGMAWLFKQLKSAADATIEAFRGFGVQTEREQINALTKSIEDREKAIARMVAGGANEKSIAAFKAGLVTMQAQKKAIEDASKASSDAAAKRASEVDAENAKIAARKKFDEVMGTNVKSQAKKQQEINEAKAVYNNLVEKGIATSADEIAKKEKLASIDKKYKEAKPKDNSHRIDARELEKNAIIGAITALEDESKSLDENGLAYDKVSQHMQNAAKWWAQYNSPDVSAANKAKAIENALLEEQAYKQQKVNDQKKADLKSSEAYNEIARKNAQDVADLNQQYEQEAKYITMTTKEKAAAQALFANEVAMNKELLELQKKIKNVKPGSEEEKNLYASIANTKAAYAEKAKSINAYLALQEKELSWQDNLTVATKQYAVNAGTYNQQVQAGFISVFGTVESALESFVIGTKTSFKDLAVSVLKQISVMLAKIAIMKAAMAVVGMVSGSASATPTTPTTTPGYSAGDLGSGLKLNAKGNAFTGTGVAKFAKGGAFTNSVVTRPTTFAFASGGTFNNGVMGEAGPEAVMPLTRTANGKLGVHTTGTGGVQNNVEVNVTMSSNGTSTTSTTADDAKSAKAMGELIAKKVKEVISEQQRPGGLLATR